LIPGIVLFTILGIAPLAVVFALIKRPNCKLAERFNLYRDMYWAWTYCIYVAFALIVWIQAQMFFLRAVHWAHMLYMFLSLVLLSVVLSPRVRAAYKQINPQIP
jgi:SNF family Na+-dependent transporter